MSIRPHARHFTLAASLLTALLLAIFSISSALLFHFNLADPMQFIMFFKNLAMAGGLLFLSNSSPGHWTIDRKLGA